MVLFGAEDGAVQAGVAEPAAGGADKQNPVVEELRGLDVDAMTPRDALNALYELKKRVGMGSRWYFRAGRGMICEDLHITKPFYIVYQGIYFQ